MFQTLEPCTYCLVGGIIPDCSKTKEESGVSNYGVPTTRNAPGGSIGCRATRGTQKYDKIPSVFKKRKHQGKTTSVDLYPADYNNERATYKNHLALIRGVKPFAIIVEVLERWQKLRRDTDRVGHDPHGQQLKRVVQGGLSLRYVDPHQKQSRAV